jgi:uncharacterized membrane protein
MDQRPQPGTPYSALLAVLLLPAAGLARRRLRCSARVIILAVASSILLSTFATGCGDRVNTAAESVNAKTYTLTVTGTATSPTGTALEHSASVTLSVL